MLLVAGQATKFDQSCAEPAGGAVSAAGVRKNKINTSATAYSIIHMTQKNNQSHA